MHPIRNWFKRNFTDPQTVNLIVILILCFLVIVIFGRLLAPVFASMVIAYLLSWMVNFLEGKGVNRLVAVSIVFFVFLVLFFFLILGLMPLLWQQIAQFFQKLPGMITWSQNVLTRLPERFPELISEKQLTEMMGGLRSEITSIGQRILSFSLSSARITLWFIAYLFLIPIMVFSFLKDKERIFDWIRGFLPKDRSLLDEVWRELDQQMGRFIRGKFFEILIVWAASYLLFVVLGLEFSMLLSFFSGLSVLIPYIGATVMTIFVASIAYFQWGWGTDFAVTLISYIVIQLLDGYVLVPVIFAEVVNLHPVAIIVSLLIFGGLWGFWGVFFSIPLATLVHVVLKSWNRRYQNGL